MKPPSVFWKSIYRTARRHMGYPDDLPEFSPYIDPITGGPNFTRFKMDVTALFQKYPKEKFVLFYSDIKNFKYINDVYGYETGNQVLKRFSALLAEEDKLAYTRMNADNFISLERYTTAEEVLKRCQQRIHRISDISGIIESMSTITIFVGAYCTEGHNLEISIDAMIDRANIARRQCKANQNAGCILYSENFRKSMLNEQRLENRMHEALANHEFVVYLQPKFDIATNTVAAAEALVRWQDPKQGLISPGVFIPLFERNGFIQKLDTYMFQQVCVLIRKWLDKGLPIIPLSVNVSKVQLNNPNFLQDYIHLKEQYDIPDQLIEIEFTESMLFDNSKRMEEVLRQFHAHGFCSSIDDFGAGYSSLNLLKKLPANILKLDKVFFDANEYQEREKIIIKNIIAMAKELSMRTVAEGVEHTDQVDFLRSVQCEMVQGFVFEKPLAVKQFEEKYLFQSQVVASTS